MLIIQLTLYFVFLYIALVIFLYFIQRRMIYYPDRKAPNKSYIQSVGLQFWPSNSKIHYGFVSKDKKKNAGTVIVFHGNAGNAKDRVYYVHVLGHLGYRVVLAEYPGYGGRSGRLSEKSLLADAKNTVILANNIYGPPIFLCGESLGCGVATGLVSDSPVTIEGLILLTPWDSLPNLAQTIYCFLPARWFVRDKYDNIQNLKKFRGRVAFAVAEHDEIIPKKHAMKLHEALSCEKRLWIWNGVGHNSWPKIIGLTWWEEVMEFLTSHN